MRAKVFFYSALMSVFTATLVGLPTSVVANTKTYYGEPEVMGNGTARTYVRLDSNGAPIAIGVIFPKILLESLPAKRNNTSRCYDLNGNGKIDDHDECEGDEEIRLSMPVKLAGNADLVVQWVGMNWNAEGHVPPGVWDLPHFDFHFYLVGREAIDQIRLGPCPLFIDCEDLKRATLPVAAKYVHPDHVNVNAAVSMMGNHLIDSKTPELGKPPQKFTHTWIFGAYDGHITFYEPMITREFLATQPSICASIKQPQAWEKAGYHPSKYCVRYWPNSGEYTVSLEGLVHYEAQQP